MFFFLVLFPRIFFLVLFRRLFSLVYSLDCFFFFFFFRDLLKPPRSDRIVGLVVKASAPRAADTGFEARLRFGDFSGSSHTSDLKIGAPLATLPGAWRYRVSAETGWPGVGKVESLICNFYLSVAAHTVV